MRNDNFYVVHGWMINELNLSGTNLLVYSIIYGFSQDGCSEYSGSLKYLMEWTGTTKPTVLKALNYLVDSGLISKREIECGSNQKAVFYKCTVPGKETLPVKSTSYTGKESLPPRSRNFTAPGKETLPNNIKDNIKDNKNNKKAYGEYQNVFLSDAELEKLKKEFPTNWSDWIEKLSVGIAANGYKYKDYLAAIKKWARRDRERNVRPPATNRNNNVKSFENHSYDMDALSRQLLGM